MKTTVEISLYPLTENYEKVVIDFILELRKGQGIEVETNGLSTQVFGKYDEVMSHLNKCIKETLLEQKAVVNLKIARGELKREQLPDVLN